jgi:hypothetical protein
MTSPVSRPKWRSFRVPRRLAPHAIRLSAYVARHSRRSCLLAVSRPWEPLRVMPGRSEPGPGY